MWSLFIPTLGKRYILPPYVRELENRLGDGLFEIMPINANVFPYLGVADLHHDMSCVISTLLVGEKIWLIYPPSAHNLSVMKDAYESIPTLAEHEYRIFKWYKELKYGVTFVQRAGETIWLPPYCAHAVFTSKSSILLGPEVFAKHKFPQRSANIGVNLMWEKTAERLYQRDDTINVLQRYLKDVLRIDDDDLNREILEAWDVFDRSGTLVELMKYSSKGYEAIEFLELWQEVAGHWSVCPVCAIGEGKAGERGRLPRNAKTKNKRWFGKHFEEVY